jgi:hypothetical protein
MLNPGVAMSKLRSRFNMGIMRSLVVGVGDIEICLEFFVNVGMSFDGSLVGEDFKRPAFIRLYFGLNTVEEKLNSLKSNNFKV